MYSNINSIWCRFFSRTVRQIPESKGLPFIGTMLAIVAAGGAPKLHLYIDKRHKEHGGIFKEKLGPVSGIFISNGNYMRKVFAAEGKYPKHIVPESWALYNEIHGCKRGLLFMDGEEWSKFRKPLNNILLKSNESQFSKATSLVARYMVNRWKNEKVITNLENQLYTWSLEVIVAILMGSSAYQEHREQMMKDIDNLAHVVHQIFNESVALSLLPTKMVYKLKLPVWKRFERAVGSAVEAGQKLLELIMSTTQKSSNQIGLISQIKEIGISNDDLNRIVIDLILAAGDTTSHTMQWILHLISVNPRVQENIQQEIDNIEENDALSCAILKGTLKEALRLYPVAPFVTRYMPDDILIDGYDIKSGELVLLSLYSSGRDGKYFPDPDSFIPERWRRTSKGYEIVNNPYASLPFAIGSRSCIGKKIAETQILITLYNILKNFHISTNHEKAIGITLHLISVPEKPIHLILKSRNS